jgi:hypothetical protein
MQSVDQQGDSFALSFEKRTTQKKFVAGIQLLLHEKYK